MMENKMSALIVTVVISVLITTSVLVPFLDNAEERNSLTYTNYGYGAELVDETVTYTWATGTGITIGTDVIPATATENGPQVLFICDQGYAKADYHATKVFFYGYDGSNLTAGADVTAMTITVNPTAKTVAISNITAANTIADTTIEYTSWCFIPSVEPTHVMYAPYSADKIMYSSTESDIYSIYHSGSSWAGSFKGETQVWDYNLSTYTTDFDGTAVNGYSGLEKYTLNLSGGDYGLEVSGTDYSPAVIVMEYKATAQSDVGNDAIAMLKIIPILVIVGIVIGIVAVAFNRRE